MFRALRCIHCRSIFRPVPTGQRSCPDCLILQAAEQGFLPDHSGFPSSLTYDGDVARLIGAFKFGNHRRAARSLGVHLAHSVREGGDRFDVVTWAPTSDGRRGRRGFDQAEEVARIVARELGLPCRRLLRRLTVTSQTGRSRHERLADAPRFVAREVPSGTRVLVIDDVVTTGATLRAAASALRDLGAHTVEVGVAATPRPHPDRTVA